MASFGAAAYLLEKSEGKYQALTNDDGNYCNGQLIGTNRGISAKFYKQYFGVCPTVDIMKALTRTQALKIYKDYFWNRLISGDLIENQSVANICLDCVFLHGAGLRLIKNAINKAFNYSLLIDSRPLTAKEINILNSNDGKRFIEFLKTARLTYIKTLPDYGEFGKGWENRIRGFTYEPSGPTAIQNIKNKFYDYLNPTSGQKKNNNNRNSAILIAFGLFDISKSFAIW